MRKTLYISIGELGNNMSKVIPRFLYHLTTRSNYEEIVRSGRLLAKHEETAGTAVFMIELQNFLKRWSSIDFHHKKSKLDKALFDYCEKDGSGLVLLRVPTQKLKSNALRVRSQEALFAEAKRLKEIKRKVDSQYHIERRNYVGAEYDKVNKTGMRRCEQDDIYVKINDAYMEQHTLPEFEDIVKEYGDSKSLFGDSAKNRRLHQQRKEAIEYIYPEDITTTQIEKIGECDSGQSIKDMLFALLKGSPEEKALFINS